MTRIMEQDDFQSVVRALAEHRLTWQDPAVQEQCRQLRADRNFKGLVRMTERAARFDPGNPGLRRLQAQALIDLGQLATALCVIADVSAELDPDDPEWPELQGLRGRAYKQIIVESGNHLKVSHGALLARAISAYRVAYDAGPGRYWHGVNLLALESLAVREGLAPEHQDAWETLAEEVMSAAQEGVKAKQDPWAYATVAEVWIARWNLEKTEAALQKFLSAPTLTSFHVGSLLRQLIQVWRLADRDDSWQGILVALRAVHAKLPGTDATFLDARDIRQQRAGEKALKIQFERIIGKGNLVTFGWWKLVMQRAAGVAAVYDENGSRIGTAFAIEGKSLLDKWTGTTLVLTNFHVVNQKGLALGLRPENATLVFEAVDAEKHYSIEKILWESPPHEFDCAILLLDEAPPASGVAPIAKKLPLTGQQSAPRVFVIGHPEGRGLEFSINDNDLLDHDEAKRQPVTRVHYRAATEEGSSGSPVYKEGRLEAIAIHHGYTRSRLIDNELDDVEDKQSSYEANEGIGLQSLKAMLESIEEDLPNIP